MLVFPTSSTSMLDILVGFAMFRVRSPLTMAGGADGCVPCRVLPVPSPVRRKTTDSVRRIERVFFGAGMEGVSGLRWWAYRREVSFI